MRYAREAIGWLRNVRVALPEFMPSGSGVGE